MDYIRSSKVIGGSRDPDVSLTRFLDGVVASERLFLGGMVEIEVSRIGPRSEDRKTGGGLAREGAWDGTARRDGTR
jgi:hypothetical protein